MSTGKRIGRRRLLAAAAAGLMGLGADMRKPLRPDSTIIVNIDMPAPNSQVTGGGTFKTFGYCAPNMGVTKTAQIADGSTIYNGTAVSPIPHSPAYQWGFKFTGIPTGHAVLLTVQGQDGSGNVGSDTISITCVA